MTHQVGSIGAAAWICAVALGLLFALQPGGAVTPPCTQAVMQSLAPSDTTIVTGTEQSDPVPYCDVRGYVTTDNPGPNQVNRRR